MGTNRKMNPLDEKFKKDKLKFARITNDDLVCRDCRNKYDDKELPCNTSKCEIFDIKPNKVLNGGECDEYKSEEIG